MTFPSALEQVKTKWWELQQTVPETKGAHLLSPHYRHVNAQMKTISAHPKRGVPPCAVHLVEISTFRSDNSRSYAIVKL